MSDTPNEPQPDQPTPDKAEGEQYPDLTEDNNEADDAGHEGETQG